MRKTFSLDGETILAEYQAGDDGSVEVGLAFDPMSMWTPRWSWKVEETEADKRVGLRLQGGQSVTLTVGGGDVQLSAQVNSFVDSPARLEWRHDPDRDYPSGHYYPYPFAQLQADFQVQKDFTLRLTLAP